MIYNLYFHNMSLIDGQFYWNSTSRTTLTQHRYIDWLPHLSMAGVDISKIQDYKGFCDYCNNTLDRNIADIKQRLKPGDGLVCIVTTSQIPDFKEFLERSKLNTQKTYVLPPARNRNYPERVHNPDNGFCLHTYVFELDEEFFK